ncbi:membrane protein [Betaproteobacteria bacterium]|nr:membrane protein [Betaproteobacteria bacterium]
MKHVLLAILVAITSFVLVVDDAYARRLGGGSSFGMKRTTPPASTPRQADRPQQQSPASTPPKRSWTGPLAGLAAGLGLAALFSHLGLGEGMANFVMLLLLAAVALFLFKMFRRRTDTPTRPLQFAGAGAPFPGAAAAPAAAPARDEAFDAAAFTRQARLNFIRLQTANDAGNLDDLREFTTPEVYAEISMQIAERGGAAQQTEVVELEAEVVELSKENARYIVSVNFSGLLREKADAAPAPFSEIWHLVKPVTGSEGWRIAGIQQIS